MPHDDLRPTVAYEPQHISADRLQFLIENVVAGNFAKSGALTVFLDSETNRLYVTGPPQLHTKIDALLSKEDVEPTEASRPFRIYRPRNRLARELISILSEVLPVVSVSTPMRPFASYWRLLCRMGSSRSIDTIASPT